MGTFDSVYVNCPHCNQRTELQSKGGPCEMESYELEDAPLDVMADLVSGRGWLICNHCNKHINIEVVDKPSFKVSRG